MLCRLLVKGCRVVAALAILAVLGAPELAYASGVADVTLWATPIYSAGINGFTITYVNNQHLDFGWYFGTDATKIMIRGKYGSYPDDISDENIEPSDGYLVYYGDATSCSDTSMDFDTNIGPIYYKAWGQKADGKWLLVASSGLKENAVIVLMVFTLVTLALTGFAAWARKIPWYAGSILAWLIWTYVAGNTVYPTGNAYLVIGVASFGIFMAIVMIMLLAKNISDAVPREPSHAEIMDRHRRRILSITSPYKRPTYREIPRIPYPQIDKEERRRYSRGKEEENI